MEYVNGDMLFDLVANHPKMFSEQMFSEDVCRFYFK